MRKKKSPSSKCSAGSEGSGLVLKGRVWKGTSGRVFGEEGIAPTLYGKGTGKTGGNAPIVNLEDSGGVVANPMSDQQPFVVSGPMTTTNTPAKSTEKGSDIKSLLKGIFGKLTPILFPILNYLPLDSHAKLSQSLENAKDSKIQGELFSLKSAEYLKLRNPDGFYLRTLKGFLAMIKDTHSKSSYPRWMNWGLMCNGKCLTLKLSYPKIARGSLSSVLEEKANEKYYLSDKNLAKILEKKDAHPNIRWKSGIRGEGKVQFPDRVDKPSRTITPAEGGANRMTHGVMVLGDILEEKVDEKYYLSEKWLNYMKRHCKSNWPKTTIADCIDATQGKGPSKQRANVVRVGGLYDKETRTHQAGSIYDPKGISPIVDTAQGGHREPLIPHKARIRRLTPIECERLQGFPDGWTAKGMDVDGNKTKISDTQRYKTMGNAVSIPVIEAIGKAILKSVARWPSAESQKLATKWS